MAMQQQSEADLVAAFLANGGSINRCPTGKGALDMEYVYVEGKGLISKDPEAGKRAFRQGMGSHFRAKKTEPTPEQIKRRNTIAAQMDAGQTGRQIATMLGINVQTVYNDAKAMGRSFPRPDNLPKVTERVTARRNLVKELVGEGLSIPEIAKRVDSSPRTVWDDVKALGLEVPKARPAYKNPNQRRPGPAPKPEVIARRKKIPGMIEQGMGGREMSDVLGVPLSTVQHDCKVLGISIPRGRRTAHAWVSASLAAHKATANRLASEMRKAGSNDDEIRETLLAIVKEAA